MPNLFHFAKGLPTQSTALAYGVKTATEFRVTSSFQMTSDVTAYAILPGTILLQQQTGNPEKVNLILKPSTLSGIKMPVKYIIYRGLQTSSFLNGTDLTGDSLATIKTDESTELLKELESTQRERMNIQQPNPITIPLQTLFGSNLTPENTLDIDTFFYEETEDAFQLFSVSGGMELGNFAADKEGIEIILENPDLLFTVELAKKAIYTIDVSGITNEAEKKWKREQIRHFVDPAAFYGLHSDIKEGIEYRNTVAKPEEGWPKTISIKDVYENIIDKFSTKNDIYLDVRNENGYSYNYYNNYLNGNFKIGKQTTQEMPYSWDGWPIFKLNSVNGWNESFNYFTLSLKIANDTDIDPLVIGRYAINITDNQDKNVIKNKSLFFIDRLKIENDDTYTKEFTVIIPKYIDENQNNHNITTIIRLDYIKKPHLENTASLLPQKKPTDFIFAPVNTKIPWQGNAPIKWMNSYVDRYFYSDDTITALQSGMVEETLNGEQYFTYYTAPLVYFKSLKRIKDRYVFNFNGGTVNAENFLTYFDLKSSAGIDKDNATNILYYKITSEIIEGGDTFLLGLTKVEKERLLPTNTFSEYHHVFFKLIETSEQNKFELITVGVVVNNNDMIQEEYCNPDAPIYVYSRDNKIFTSTDYQTAIDFTPQPGITVHFRRTEDYATNRFHFGFDWMREGNKRDNSKEKTYVGADGLCEKANIDGTSIDDKNEAQDYLKNEYTPEIINGQTYYVPWLCMYKDHSEVVTGDANNKEGHVILQLYIDYNPKGNQKDEIIKFVPSEGININLNLKENQYYDGDLLRAKVDFLKKQQITIECTDDSNQDRVIEVLDSQGILIGKLNIFKNEKKIKRKVCFMNLILIGDLKLSPTQTVRFEETKITPNYISNSTSNIPYPTFLFKNKWNNYLKEDNKNIYTKKILHQSLVKYEPKRIDNNGIIQNTSNFKINFSYSSTGIDSSSYVEIDGIQLGFNDNSEIVTCIDTFLKTILFVFTEKIAETDYPAAQFNSINTVGSALRTLMEEIKKVNNITVNNLFAYFDDFVFLPGLFFEFTGDDIGTTAFSDKVNLIVLCGNPNTDQKEIIAHEIAHNLKLSHSFSEKNIDYSEEDGIVRNIYNENKKFIFKKYNTENIMDYSDATKPGNIPKKVSFWKWQWKKILDNNNE